MAARQQQCPGMRTSERGYRKVWHMRICTSLQRHLHVVIRASTNLHPSRGSRGIGSWLSRSSRAGGGGCTAASREAEWRGKLGSGTLLASCTAPRGTRCIVECRYSASAWAMGRLGPDTRPGRLREGLVNCAEPTAAASIVVESNKPRSAQSLPRYPSWARGSCNALCLRERRL